MLIRRKTYNELVERIKLFTEELIKALNGGSNVSTNK